MLKKVFEITRLLYAFTLVLLFLVMRWEGIAILALDNQIWAILIPVILSMILVIMDKIECWDTNTAIYILVIIAVFLLLFVFRYNFNWDFLENESLNLLTENLWLSMFWFSLGKTGFSLYNILK